MKKLLASILALTLAAAMAVPAFATSTTVDEEDGSPATAEAVIKTSIAPTYTVSIPENTTVAFNATETSFGSIEVTAAQINPDMQISVSVPTGNELINQTDNTKTLPYTIEDANGEFTSAAYLAAGDKTDLTINIEQDDWNSAYAGDYEDEVIFTITYEEIPTT